MVLSLVKSLLLLVVTIVMAVIAILLTPFNSEGKTFHWCAKTWGRLLLFIASIKVRVKGLEHLQVGTTYIYAANHASYFDIPAFLAFVPQRIRIAFKKELGRLPIFGWALKLGNYVSIDRGDSREAVEGLERAARQIREGASVLLFPEGTRTRDGKLQPFKRGAFALAVRSRVPLVPVTVNGSYSILPKKGFRINRGEIELIFHPPLATNGWSGREGELQLMERVRSVIAADYIEP